MSSKPSTPVATRGGLPATVSIMVFPRQHARPSRRPRTPAVFRPGLLAVDVSQHPVEPPVVEAGDQPEGVGPLEEAAADRLRDFLGQEQKLLLVGVEGGGEPADQVFAGVVAEVELAVLDLADVGERHADPLAQRPLAEALGGAHGPKSVAEAHCLCPHPPRVLLLLSGLEVNRKRKRIEIWGAKTMPKPRLR